MKTQNYGILVAGAPSGVEECQGWDRMALEGEGRRTPGASGRDRERRWARSQGSEGAWPGAPASCRTEAPPLPHQSPSPKGRKQGEGEPQRGSRGRLGGREEEVAAALECSSRGPADTRSKDVAPHYFSSDVGPSLLNMSQSRQRAAAPPLEREDSGTFRSVPEDSGRSRAGPEW